MIHDVACHRVNFKGIILQCTCTCLDVNVVATNIVLNFLMLFFYFPGVNTCSSLFPLEEGESLFKGYCASQLKNSVVRLLFFPLL